MNNEGEYWQHEPSNFGAYLREDQQLYQFAELYSSLRHNPDNAQRISDIQTIWQYGRQSWDRDHRVLFSVGGKSFHSSRGFVMLAVNELAREIGLNRELLADPLFVEACRAYSWPLPLSHLESGHWRLIESLAMLGGEHDKVAPSGAPKHIHPPTPVLQAMIAAQLKARGVEADIREAASLIAVGLGARAYTNTEREM